MRIQNDLPEAVSVIYLEGDREEHVAELESGRNANIVTFFDGRKVGCMTGSLVARTPTGDVRQLDEPCVGATWRLDP